METVFVNVTIALQIRNRIGIGEQRVFRHVRTSMVPGGREMLVTWLGARSAGDPTATVVNAVGYTR
jgi:hypothetical protein